MDTSALTGQPYLPAMISESSADLYHSLSPTFTREVIRASRVSGVEDSFAVAQFTGGMHGDVNFYDHFIDLFDVRFAGPLVRAAPRSTTISWWTASRSMVARPTRSASTPAA